MIVHIVCQRPDVMRILQSMAHCLVTDLGWTIGPYPSGEATVNYFFNYADGWWRFSPWTKTPVAAYFTHYESVGHKAALWDECAETGDEDLVVGGEAARRLLINWIRTKHVVFTPAELAAFAKTKKSKATFAP